MESNKNVDVDKDIAKAIATEQFDNECSKSTV